MSDVVKMVVLEVMQDLFVARTHHATARVVFLAQTLP